MTLDQESRFLEHLVKMLQKEFEEKLFIQASEDKYLLKILIDLITQGKHDGAYDLVELVVANYNLFEAGFLAQSFLAFKTNKPTIAVQTAGTAQMLNEFVACEKSQSFYDFLLPLLEQLATDTEFQPVPETRAGEPVYRSEYEAWLRAENNRSILPFLDGNSSLAIFINAKCANSTLLNWHFDRLGLIPSVKILNNIIDPNYHLLGRTPWHDAIHDFQHRSYYPSAYYEHQEARYLDYLDGVSDERWHSYKFVRNPFRRLVGSYLLFMRNNTPTYGNTFRNFVTSLAGEDLSCIDVHFQHQVFSYETSGEFTFDGIFKIEDGIEEQLESMLEMVGSSVPNAKKAKFNSQNVTLYSDQSGDNVANVDFLGEVFNEKKAPNIGQFYDDDLIEKVYELYEIDFETYGYDSTLPS